MPRRYYPQYWHISHESLFRTNESRKLREEELRVLLDTFEIYLVKNSKN